MNHWNILYRWLPDAEHWFNNGVNYANTKQLFVGNMHIIANNAVSRTKKGKGFWVGPDASTVFPSSLVIDYIRYYKMNYDAITWISILKNNELTNTLTQEGASTTGIISKKQSRSNQLMGLYIDGLKQEDNNKAVILFI